jgi:hypothetical protein
MASVLVVLVVEVEALLEKSYLSLLLLIAFLPSAHVLFWGKGGKCTPNSDKEVAIPSNTLSTGAFKVRKWRESVPSLRSK